MNKLHYSSVNEELYQETLPNGLQVYVLPKPKYHKTYVTLSTPLGSTVNRIQTGDTYTELPLGIAHFLEHKLFDQEGEDISTRFAMNSAQVNAYTMNERTTYLFSCTEQLYANMDTLLDFVFHPVFTTEGIEKEIGIIAQEISMYEDDPNTAIYMGILRNLYHTHPVKDDILGTVESISTITKELLYQVHSMCYHPSKMVLFVAGNVDPKELFEYLHNHSFDTPSQDPAMHKPSSHEPDSIVIPAATKEMDVMLPNALFGIKLPIQEIDTSNIIKWELVFSILSDMLVGKSTPLFQELLTKGLINDTFGVDISIEQEYGFLLFGSNTKQPDEFVEAMKDMIVSIDPEAFDDRHFLRCKKQLIGQFIQALNSLEYIANQFTKYQFQGTSLFDILTIAEDISLNDLKQVLPWIQQPEKMSHFIIVPK